MTEDTSQQQSNGQVDASDFQIEAPDRTRPDEPIPVRILGASPNEVVEFEAAMEDEDGIEWRSTATFRATGEGIVDLSKHAPESGSYGGVRSMGWYWSMEAVDSDQLVTALMTPEPTEVQFQATAGEQNAARTITRAIPEGVSRTELLVGGGSRTRGCDYHSSDSVRRSQTAQVGAFRLADRLLADRASDMEAASLTCAW